MISIKFCKILYSNHRLKQLNGSVVPNIKEHSGPCSTDDYQTDNPEYVAVS